MEEKNDYIEGALNDTLDEDEGIDKGFEQMELLY